MNAQNSAQICKVLVADDSDDDRYLLRLRLRNQTQFQVVGEVCDGQDAIAYLRGEASFSDRAKYPLPDLMLMDLRMPRVTGFEVLEWLLTQAFGGLKVVVLAGSAFTQDLVRSLELGAHAYHVKDCELDEPAFLEKLIAVIASDTNAHFGPKSPKSAKIVILVRHKETHEYLSAKGEWVRQEEAATKFESPRHATEVCRKLALNDAEIVMRLGGGRELKIDVRWA